MVETSVVGGGADDESTVAEQVADDIGVVGLRDVVHHDVLQTGLGSGAGNDLGGALGVAVHRAVADDEARLGLIAREAVVDADNLPDVLVPDGTVGCADIVDLDAGELLEGHLHGRAVLADDVGVVARHLEPEGVAVHLLVDVGTVEGAEAAEGVAGEEYCLLL